MMFLRIAEEVERRVRKGKRKTRSEKERKRAVEVLEYTRLYARRRRASSEVPVTRARKVEIQRVKKKKSCLRKKTWRLVRLP